MEIDDRLDFAALTKEGERDGHEPMVWQRRLFDRFYRNDIPLVCDLPTGLGKTCVIHLWLLALRKQIGECKPRLPTRLVYVVDRRTVVDQATKLAERIKKNLPLLGLPGSWLSVSTLRGQLADNREWTVDPSRPAIIIGTVDMIGSRLLFSGYRSSFKQRPLEAGFLGQDTLLVLDEAHLSQPFSDLIHSLSDKGTFQRGQGLPMRVMCMSATSSSDQPEQFKLEESDLEGTPDANPTLKRYGAIKRLSIEIVDPKATQKSIIDAAYRLAEDKSRVVVFVRQPDKADEIARALKRRGPLQNAVEVLTGTMRGLERDELLNKPVLRRFLDGDERPDDRFGKGRAILVSTSAGEVGVDLNADHMVSDGAPLDSMIQRLGRVNRRGHGDARVFVFCAKSDGGQGRGVPAAGKHTVESATTAALNCLKGLAKNDEDGTRDASPRAIDLLRAQLTKEQFLAASTPKPATVELTDILLDAWSMTTITEPMPGRPSVGPWLRGLDAEEAQTTISWRAELDLEGFDQLDAEEIEDWFDAHRILPHETLTVPTSKAAKWFVDRWDALPTELRDVVGGRSCIIDHSGIQTTKVKNLVEELKRKRTDSIVYADIVLSAAFGGINEHGLLDKDVPSPEDITPESLKAPDVADRQVRRHRHVRRFGDGSGSALLGKEPDNLAGLGRFAIDLPCVDDERAQLISFSPKYERIDVGTSKQSLSSHVIAVEEHARVIARELRLPSEESLCTALAAAWHDHGKDRDIWQRAVGRKVGEHPLGKSGGPMQRIPGGYRHEFGSLRQFIEAHEEKIPRTVFDLAMHMIAAHHGRGRPHFPKGGSDPEAPARSPQIAAGVVCRFSELQRQYGYWRLAWLENLLRCADALASSENSEK